MGVLEIAERLRSLASDPEHRHAIVHDQHMLPTLTVWFCGWLVIAGGTTTVSIASELVAEPATLPELR